MFENLTSRLKAVADGLRGRGRLTEENISDAVKDVRRALIEADVALPVVRQFVDKVREQAVGAEIAKSLSPGQVFIKILHSELTVALGGDAEPFDLRHQPPVVILLAGLQGAGKTTTAAKLAKHFIGRENRSVTLASLDLRRPAAVLQLEKLAERVGANFFPTDIKAEPEAIAADALAAARRSQADVLILDTAGRSRLDDDLLDELRRLHEVISPQETFFVIDSMAGQDAVNVAGTFAETVPLTGLVLTKADGDARGGAALSVRHVTGKPVRFLGVGEDIAALEQFHPDRMASRILGMGDVLSLVEEVEQKVDRESAEKLARKVRKGRGFDLDDLKDQLSQMVNMGGLEGLLDKLPLPDGISASQISQQVDPAAIGRQVAIINSMTPQERKFPKVINGSRKRRIAAGAGQAIQDVNRLLKQHAQMQKTMKRFSKGGLRGKLKGLPGMPR